MPTIARFQFVTPTPLELPSFYQMIDEVCAAGVRWVQLRDKAERPYAERKTIAQAVKAICKKHDATFIVNDYVQLAKEIEADGVHIGQKDMRIAEARIIVGSRLIVGKSTNTFEQIKQAQADGADYAGIGPLHFTQTKENLNPVIGYEKLHQILEQYRQENLSLPMISIGGIKLPEVNEVLSTGVHGLAVVTAISNAEQPAAQAKLFLQAINQFYQPIT